jgi:hypothetical protein
MANLFWKCIKVDYKKGGKIGTPQSAEGGLWEAKVGEMTYIVSLSSRQPKEGKIYYCSIDRKSPVLKWAFVRIEFEDFNQTQPEDAFSSNEVGSFFISLNSKLAS